MSVKCFFSYGGILLLHYNESVRLKMSGDRICCCLVNLLLRLLFLQSTVTFQPELGTYGLFIVCLSSCHHVLYCCTVCIFKP